MSVEGIYSDYILQGMMDTDAYKLHMLQAIIHNYPTATATFELRVRNDEDLRPYRAAIEREIEAAAGLSFSDSDLRYLARLPYIRGDFVETLRHIRLDPKVITVSVEDEQLMIRARGSWAQAMLWEIPILAIISEVRNRHRFPDVSIESIRRDTFEKIRHLRDLCPDGGIPPFVDFGSRRRSSFKAHREVVDILRHELRDQFLGTSNYHLAKEMGLKPSGTQAHEWHQAHQALGVRLADSQKAALETWAYEYRGQLAIALTDCITTDAFLRDFDLFLAKLYDGLRQDSGDPIEWGEKVIKHYEKLGIDPREKTLVFSDSLDFDRMCQIHRHFSGRAKMLFGIGTFLTGRFEAIEPLNIVFKMVRCNDQPVVKISDDAGKLTSVDPDYLHMLRYSFKLDAPEDQHKAA